MKQLSFFFLFFFSLANSQITKQLKILDSESNTGIHAVRIIAGDEVFYTNEDGMVTLPEQATRLDISTSGFEILKNTSYQSVIKLKPLYKDIDEVKIVSIEVRKIFEEVLKNYSAKYYDKPALYDVTYSQKSFENDQMKLLMVADGKFWTRDGRYDRRDASKGKLASFVQLQVDKLRYFETKARNFNIIEKKSARTHDNVGLIFFDYELQKVINLMNVKGATVSSFLLYENDEDQEISFRIKTTTNLFHTGTFTFNKTDRVITNLEVSFDQKGYAPDVRKDESGIDYVVQLGNGTIRYEFYKSGKKYVPSIFSFKTEGYKYTSQNKTYDYRTAREIVFKTYSPAKQSTFKNPVDISSNFWTDMKVSDEKGLVNLSAEELRFVKDKNDQD